MAAESNRIESIRNANRHELTRNLSLPDTLMSPNFRTIPPGFFSPLIAPWVRTLNVAIATFWHVMTPALSPTDTPAPFTKS